MDSFLFMEEWTTSLLFCKETREVYMCCVDFMKGYNCVPLGGLWEVLQEYGVIGARDTNHPVIVQP